MDLNDQIAQAEQFTARDPHAAPVVDQGAQAAFALDWASRQASRPQPPEPPKAMAPIVPVAN